MRARSLIVAAAALACLAVVEAKPMVYTCDATALAQCNTEFVSCSEKRQSRDRDTNCRCWTDSYVCFRDCAGFPNNWNERCRDECDEVHCTPPGFSAGAGAVASARLLGGVLVSAAAVLARPT